MYKLHPHQTQAVNDLRAGFKAGHLCQILAAATGFGKTVVAAELIQCAVRKAHKVLFIVHQKQLVWQAVDTFSRVGLNVGIIQGDNTDCHPSHDVVVACVASLRNRRAPEWIGLVLIDECHVLWKAHIELMKTWNALPFLGLSATPLRPDLGKYFTNLIRGPSIAWLMDHGFLVPVKAFAPGADQISRILDGVSCNGTNFGEKDYNQLELGEAMNTPRLVGDILSTWQKKGDHRQTLCFPVNKAHSRSIVEAFSAAGIPAAHIEDTTPDQDRQQLFAAFQRGDVRVLSSVGVLSTGFDAPIAGCGILARPTASLTLHIQQVGRLLRITDGKAPAIILDHAGNCLRHGLPQHFEVPDLDSKDRDTTRSPATKKEPRTTICQQCDGLIPPDKKACPCCGAEKPQPKPNIQQIDGELVSYGTDHPGKDHFTQADHQRWYSGFIWYAEIRGYNPKWANANFHDKFGFWPPDEWGTLQPAPPESQQAGWIKHRQIRYAKRRDARCRATH